MAITRRQFVTRMGALAAAVGVSQSHLTKLTEAFAYGNFSAAKPKVIWVHGAECTGCSTSVLSLFEDVNETTEAGVTLGAALGLTGVSLQRYRTNYMDAEDSTAVVDIADVLLEVIDLQYHETVMSMGGDLAYQYLDDQITGAGGGDEFVLVVEGAISPTASEGFFNSDPNGGGIAGGDLPWCSIAMNDAGTGELAFADVVGGLANHATCAAVVAIGQCATFGGYPAAVSPTLRAADGSMESMTGAMGCHEYLRDYVGASAADKVINVPGCPVNPWWFALTVVLWLIDANAILGGSDGPLGILTTANFPAPEAAAVDADRRLNLVYDYKIHGANCPRFPYWAGSSSVSPTGVPIFADAPGDEGCLYNLGCKGIYTKSMCGVHGWNGIQPPLQTNGSSWDSGIAGECATVGTNTVGGFCISAGATCKGCTERGYPDSFVPFVALD